MDRHGADLNGQVWDSTPCPTPVPSTHAGALFQAFWTSSMHKRARAERGAGPAFLVCPLPNPGAYLQLLRPRSDLLCRRLCAGGAISLPACRRSALPDEPPRAPGPCGTGPSLARPAKQRDASGFTTTATG